MITFLKKYWPFIFLLFITFIYSFPYLFQGKIPFPSSYVANNLAPWNKYLPHGPIKNGIPDVPGEIFPLRSLVIDYWKNNVIPLWNPYAFSGNPLLANFQSAAFFPGNLLFIFLAKVDSWSILVLLQPLLAAIFTYLLCRSLNLSKTSSLFSSISFMFCGYLTVWGSYTTMGYTILFLPLMLWLLEKYLQGGKSIFLPFLSLFLAASFFSGHIQAWTYVFLSSVIYTIVRSVTGSTYKKIFLPIFFVFLSIPLVAVQFLPTWEFYQVSGRVLANNASSNAGIPIQYLITLLAPDFFGNPVTRNDWFGTYAEWSGFSGFAALIFATTAFFSIKKEKKLWAFLVIGLTGVFLSIQTPVLQVLTSSSIPILSNSNPARAIILVSFAIAVLSGFGIEQLTNNWNKVKTKVFIVLSLVSTILIFLLAITIFGKFFFSMQTTANLRNISMRNLIFPIGVLIAFWILVVGLWFKPKWKTLIISCLIIVSTLEMLRFYTKWTPFDAKTSFYKDIPVTDFLRKHGNYYRFYGQFTQSAGYMNHILTTDGYESLNLLSYAQLLGGARNGQLSQDYQREVKLQSQEKYTQRLLNILNVKYLVYGADDIRNPFVFPFWDYGTGNFPQIFTDGKFTIFENKWVLLRPSLFNKYRVITDRRTALSTLLSDNFDYRRDLILDSNPGIKGSLGTGSAVMKKYTPNKIEIETETDGPSLLFLSDNYYPGWQAYVNGQKSKVLLADFTFRAVVVPAGKSQVIFRYEPESFKYGIIVSGVTLLLLLIFTIVIARSETTKQSLLRSTI